MDDQYYMKQALAEARKAAERDEVQTHAKNVRHEGRSRQPLRCM